MDKDKVKLVGFVIGILTDDLDRSKLDQLKEDLFDSFRNLISVEEAFESYILEFEDVLDTDLSELIDRIDRIRARYVKE
jgi:arsenate reductase-like glutaredoxin family protein